MINSTYLGEVHSLLVLAEVEGLISSNRSPSTLTVASNSPVLTEGVVIKSFFVPTDALTIELDQNKLTFLGALGANHTGLQENDYIVGETSNNEYFVKRILEVIRSEVEFVELLVSSQDAIDEIYKELDFNSQFAVSRHGKRSDSRRRLLEKSPLTIIGEESF